jgi:hypothetical protein
LADVDHKQTTIPVPDGPNQGECSYCRKPAYTKVVAETGGTKKVANAITFWVCDYHLGELRKNNPKLQVVGEINPDITKAGEPRKRQKPKPNWAKWLK